MFNEHEHWEPGDLSKLPRPRKLVQCQNCGGTFYDEHLKQCLLCPSVLQVQGVVGPALHRKFLESGTSGITGTLPEPTDPTPPG